MKLCHEKTLIRLMKDEYFLGIVGKYGVDESKNTIIPLLIFCVMLLYYHRRLGPNYISEPSPFGYWVTMSSKLRMAKVHHTDGLVFALRTDYPDIIQWSKI